MEYKFVQDSFSVPKGDTKPLNHHHEVSIKVVPEVIVIKLQSSNPRTLALKIQKQINLCKETRSNQFQLLQEEKGTKKATWQNKVANAPFKCIPLLRKFQTSQKTRKENRISKTIASKRKQKGNPEHV